MKRRKPRLSQCFLVNDGVARTIARTALGGDGARVVEIGAGTGALTRHLAAGAARLVAVEVDPPLAEALAGDFEGDPRVHVVTADALTVSWDQLVALACEGAGDARVEVRLAGNLPYHVATAIVLQWLARSCGDARLVAACVMVQAEVAERLVAPPGVKAYGSLSVLAQANHDVRWILGVGPGSFRPVPQVRSAVVELRRREVPRLSADEWKAAAAFVHAAFAHRRKQMAVALAGHVGLSRETWRERLVSLGHAPDVRAERLSPAQLLTCWRGMG